VMDRGVLLPSSPNGPGPTATTCVHDKLETRMGLDAIRMTDRTNKPIRWRMYT